LKYQMLPPMIAASANNRMNHFAPELPDFAIVSRGNQPRL
jgi:hypothetical protein